MVLLGPIACGEVRECIASVDESAATRKSAPVIPEAGGDRGMVKGGKKVLSDWIKVRVLANPGERFLNHMVILMEEAHRQETPTETARIILLSALTIIFLVIIISHKVCEIYSTVISNS